MKRKTGVAVHPREENPRQVIEMASSTIFVQFHSQCARWMSVVCVQHEQRSKDAQ